MNLCNCTAQEITVLYDHTRDLIVSKERRGQEIAEEKAFLAKVLKRYYVVVLGYGK